MHEIWSVRRLYVYVWNSKRNRVVERHHHHGLPTTTTQQLFPSSNTQTNVIENSRGGRVRDRDQEEYTFGAHLYAIPISSCIHLTAVHQKKKKWQVEVP